MKIFYAVQATGNGHISRAMELIPHLQRFAEVDIFLSGGNCHLTIDAPVKYRSEGLSLYYNSNGRLDYWKIVRGFHPLTLRKEINDLPVEKYDLIINDFEFITAAACTKKRIPSVQMGHQASFQSRLTPRSRSKNFIGEWILRNYSKASEYIGLHFERYDDFILPPVIKKEILDANPSDMEHVTVYLPSYSVTNLEKTFSAFNTRFHIFSKEIKQVTRRGNFVFFPVNNHLFNQSLVDCHGIITGAGFEAPAEALYLGKKLLVIPARGQYEQECNAAALEKMGVACMNRFDTRSISVIERWLETNNKVKVCYRNVIPQLLDKLFAVHESISLKRYKTLDSLFNGEPAMWF